MCVGRVCVWVWGAWGSQRQSWVLGVVEQACAPISNRSTIAGSLGQPASRVHFRSRGRCRGLRRGCRYDVALRVVHRLLRVVAREENVAWKEPPNNP